MTKSESLPRGIRNNNPGNLRWGSPWQGLVPEAERTDKDFCQFQTAAWGIRALAVTLITYQDKYNLSSIHLIIQRFAPASENDTAAYIEAVATACERADTDALDLHSYADLAPLCQAIILHENGRGPKANGRWYDAVTFDEALKLAGVVKPMRTALGVPGGTAIAVSGITGVAGAVTGAISGVQPIVGAVQAMETGDDRIDVWIKLVCTLLVATAIIAAGIAWWRKSRALKLVRA